MDSKLRKLIYNAQDSALWANSSRRWNKVAEYADDWDDVRAFLKSDILAESSLSDFNAACKRYNAKIAKNNAEVANEDSKASTGTNAAVIGAGAIIGLGLGLRHDPNKRFSVFSKKDKK